MDPLSPASFNHRDIKLTNGRQYHICDEEPEGYIYGTTPVLLLIHGFPELWYEWRYQIGAFVRRGWRVIAPDTLGYGRTDKPDERALYTPLSIAGEMAALLSTLELNHPVVIVGHDWGAIAAWAFAMRYPEKTRALVTLSIPYQLPLPRTLTAHQAASMNPNLFGYWQFFASPSAPEMIQSNLPLLIDSMYRSVKKAVNFLPLGEAEKLFNGETELNGPSDLMSDKERQYYIQTFERGGINAPLNYYRSMEDRYAQEQALKLNPVLPISMPILLIAPTGDKFATDEYIELTKPYVPSMEVVRIESGHFVMLERRDQVSEIIGDWVQKTLKAMSKL